MVSTATLNSSSYSHKPPTSYPFVLPPLAVFRVVITMNMPPFVYPFYSRASSHSSFYCPSLRTYPSHMLLVIGVYTYVYLVEEARFEVLRAVDAYEKFGRWRT